MRQDASLGDDWPRHTADVGVVEVRLHRHRAAHPLPHPRQQVQHLAASNEYLGFEYTSKSWVLSAAGVAQTTFTADDDTSIFQDDLLISALKFRYFSVKGFDTTDYAMEYQSVLSNILATEKGGKTLMISGRPSNILINMTNISDSGYGI